MIFYWGLWIIILLFSLLWKDKTYVLSYRLLFIIVIFLAVLTGGREYVGADWESYQTYYNTGYAYDKVSGKMEPLFGLLRTICYSLGCSYGLFSFVCCIISLLTLYKTLIISNTRNCFFAFLVYLSLFFCNYQFNIIRHGILASFILLAMTYLSQGRKLKSLICIIIGCGFQVMGLFFIPLLFFIDACLTRKQVFLIVGISFLLYFADISGRIISFFPILATFDRLAGYLDPDRIEAYKLSVGILGFLMIAIYSIIYRRKEYTSIPFFRIMANMLLLGFIVFCSLNGFSVLVQRIANLLNLGVVFLLPFICTNQLGIKKILIVLLTIFYLALYYPKAWNNPDENGDYSMLPFKTNITNLI